MLDSVVKLALVVHPDLAVATELHNGFQQHGLSTVVARDLPTALLMLTQHIFDVAIVSSKVAEPADGWALAGVIRLIFPSAHVAVIAPEEGVLTLKAAINSHSDQLLAPTAPEEIVASVMSKIPPFQSSTVKKRRVSSKDLN